MQYLLKKLPQRLQLEETASSSCPCKAIHPHLIPFSLQKRLILLELKPRCSGYFVFKTSAKSSIVNIYY